MRVHSAFKGPDGLSEEVTRVPIENIRMAGSPRSKGVEENHIRMLAEIADSLPPIIVHYETMTVIDGMHRVGAARLNGSEKIDVRFFRGSEKDAFQVAVQMNVKHGLPLSRNDRHAAAARILRSHPQQSDRSIAATTGLSPKTVAGIRRQTTGDEIPQIRVGRDGRTRPLNTAEGRRIASELIRTKPAAPLRQVAQQAGVSVGTVRNVRDRLLAGVDPVPSRQTNDQATQPPAPRRLVPAGERHGRQRLGSDVQAILDGLRRDPSLRYTEAGRSMLRWLSSGIPHMESLPTVVNDVPPHCGILIAQIARECANTWSSLAEQMDQLSESA